MSIQTVKVEGLRELDAALGELKKGTARAVLRRVLNKAAEPMRAAAEQMAPVRTGKLKSKIITSSNLGAGSAGKAAFAEVMKAGGTKSAARGALVSANRDAGEGSFAQVYIGPSTKAFYGMYSEFGTSKQKPRPFMRPAFDSQKGVSLDMIRKLLADEISATAKRAAARALKAK